MEQVQWVRSKRIELMVWRALASFCADGGEDVVVIGFVPRVG